VVIFPSRRTSAATTSANSWVAVSGTLGETSPVPIPRGALEFLFRVSELHYKEPRYAGTNSCVCSVNTRNKHHLQRPIANLSCSQKSAYFVGIKIFITLPSCLKSLVNEETQFKVALKRYLSAQPFYSVDEFLLPENYSRLIVQCTM
jgi:hypothetical protein